MNIKGKKIVLRAIEWSDSKMLQELINDSETEYLLGGWSFPVSKVEQQNWIQKIYDENDNGILRVIIDIEEENPTGKKEKKAIGTAILTDIDYKNGTAQIHIKLLNGEYKHKGYGTDTINTLVDYAFQELRLNCVYSKIVSYNYMSQKLFEKCGFKQEGVLRKRLYKKGDYNDVIVYSIINS